ncbi:MAG TPA: hypothetical protein VGN81_29625 [Pseudonocardiaceae bacterium]|jgi:hypothetical protein
MGWPETHRYYAALRTVEEELDRTGDGLLPWRAEYAEIFGDRHGLLLALSRRWQVLVQAQVERLYDEDGRPSAELRDLTDAHPGLVRAIERQAQLTRRVA